MSKQPTVLSAMSITHTDDTSTLHYEDNLSCEFSREELARLLEIKRRPSRPASHEREIIPLEPCDFSPTQKRYYAEIHGDALAYALFGHGPWLKSEQTRMSTERRKKRDGK
jgi:hypothetical protein